MVRQYGRTFSLSDVSKIGNSISSAEKVGGAADIPHWQGEVESGEGLGFRSIGRYTKVELGGFLQSDPDVHVCVS